MINRQSPVKLEHPMLPFPWDQVGLWMECCKGWRCKAEWSRADTVLAPAALQELPVWCQPFISVCLCSLQGLPGRWTSPHFVPSILGSSQGMWRLTGKISSPKLPRWWNSPSPERFPVLFSTSSVSYWWQKPLMCSPVCVCACARVRMYTHTNTQLERGRERERSSHTQNKMFSVHTGLQHSITIWATFSHGPRFHYCGN